MGILDGLPSWLKPRGSEKKAGPADSRLVLKGPTEAEKTPGDYLIESLNKLFPKSSVVVGAMQTGTNMKVQEVVVSAGGRAVVKISLRKEEQAGMCAPDEGGAGEDSTDKKEAKERKPVSMVNYTYTVSAQKREWLDKLQSAVGNNLFGYACVGAYTPATLEQKRRDEAGK